MSGTSTKTATVKAPKSAVTIETKLPEIAEGQATERYWVGAMPGCPIQNPTAGGVAFPSFTGEHINAAGDMLPDKQLSKGSYVDLTEEQVEVVKIAVLLRMVRFSYGGDGDQFERGDVENPRPKNRPRAHMVMLDSPRNRDGYRYAASRNDVPLARLVYMHNVEAMTVGQQNAWPPHPMEKPKE